MFILLVYFQKCEQVSFVLWLQMSLCVLGADLSHLLPEGVPSVLLSWCVCAHHGEPPTNCGVQLLSSLVQRRLLCEAAQQSRHQNFIRTLFQDPSSPWKMC